MTAAFVIGKTVTSSYGPWLGRIYAEERDLEIKLGMPELLRRLAQAGVTAIIDVSRMNVAQFA